MPEPVSEDDRLEVLRLRWERDPGSRIFLQLAEEYRRHGKLAEAVRTLEKGLATQPGYLSARVSLGRCRLELGDAVGACQVLETVLAADPTQLVANKLLIESYLRTAQPERARDRLDLYMLLNESDPEIATLERRILALERAPLPPPAEPVAPALPRSAATPAVDSPRLPVPASAPEVETETAAFGRLPVEDPPVGEPLALPALELGALSLADIPLPRGAKRALVGERRLASPFPTLHRSADALAIAERLAGEGIFRRRRPERPTPVAIPAGPPPGIETEPLAVAGIAPLPDVVAAAPAPLGVVRPLEEEATAPELPSPWWKIPAAPEAPVPIETRAVDSAPAVPVLEVSSGPAVSELAVETQPFVSEIGLPPVLALEESATEATPVPPVPEDAATATLGDLYLQQGHLEEAEETFRAVLSREPGHVQASAGLDAVGRRRRELNAEALLGRAAPTGLTARKIRMLQSYLERIREGARRHVS